MSVTAQTKAHDYSGYRPWPHATAYMYLRLLLCLHHIGKKGTRISLQLFPLLSRISVLIKSQMMHQGLLPL